MREIKILVVLIVVVGVLYWGVEPLAHSVFHPKAAPADFEFRDLARIDLSKGNKERGEELFQGNCQNCHNLKAKGFESEQSEMAGVVMPDLSTAGAIYNENFLAAFIINPAQAVKLEHKDYMMPPYFAQGEDENLEQEVADIVAFLKSIGEASLKQAVNFNDEFIAKKEAIEKSNLSESQKSEAIENARTHITDKVIFLDACSRCHSIKYDEPKTAEQIAANNQKKVDIEAYLGAKAPDLSMMIRSKGEHYLEWFINDPQKKSYKEIKTAILDEDANANLSTNTKKSEWQEDEDFSNLAREMGVLPVGLSMPRVGLNEESQGRVVRYLESIGDSKKAERESLGVSIIIFFGVLSIFAYLWKRKKWKDLH